MSTKTSRSKKLVGNIDEKILTCTMCLQRFREPKILPCLHSFCAKCLNQWAKKNRGNLTCPICRKECQLPEEGVSGLPNCYFANSLIEIIEDETSGRRSPESSTTGSSSNGRNIQKLIKPPPKLSKRQTSSNLIVAEDNRAKLHKLLNDAKIKETRVVEAMNSIRSVQRRINSDKDKAEADIHKQTAWVAEKLKIHEKELVEELQKMHKSKLNLFAVQMDQLGRADEVLKSSCEFTDNLLKYGGENEVRSHYRQTAERLQDLLKLDVRYHSTESSQLELMRNQEFPQERIGRLITNTVAAFQSTVAMEVPRKSVRPGISQTFLVTKKDFEGKQVKEGGSAIVNAEIRTPKGPAKATEVDVCDNGNGTYSIIYKPKMEGKHSLIATVFGQRVKDSPLFFNVSLTKKPIKRLGEKEMSEGRPSGIAIAENGDIFIADNKTNIHIFTKQGSYKHHFTLGSKSVPEDVAILENRFIVVTDSGVDQLLVFDMDGHYVRRIADNELRRPLGIAIADKGFGDIFVADYDCNCIRRYRPAGALEKVFGTKGSDPGQLKGPSFLAINSKNEVIVSDYLNNRIQVFSKEGDLLLHCSNQGDTKLKLPKGVYVDQKDNILVCDTFNKEVKIFAPNGKLKHLIELDWDAVRKPEAMVAMPSNPARFLIVDMDNRSIKIFEDLTLRTLIKSSVCTIL